MVRNRFSLALTILTTPFFLFLYWFVFIGSESVQIGIYKEMSRDSLATQETNGFLDMMLSELKKQVAKESSKTKFEWTQLNKNPFDKILLNENPSETIHYNVVLILKPDLNLKFPNEVQSVEILNDGKLSSILLSYQIKEKILESNGERYQLPIKIQIQNLGKDPFQFSNFAIGFIVFAMIMMIFSSSQTIATEIETNTWIRYRLAKLPILSYLLGMGAVQILFGMLSILISYICIKLLRIDLSFHLLSFIAVSFLGLAVHIQLGFCLAGIFKNPMLVFLGSSFFMFLLLLFSGILFPSPPAIPIWDGHSFDIFGTLPSAIVKKLLDLSSEKPINLKTFYLLLIQLVGYLILFLSLNTLLLKRRYISNGNE